MNIMLHIIINISNIFRTLYLLFINIIVIYVEICRNLYFMYNYVYNMLIDS